MTKITTENYFVTSTLNTISNSITWEIEIQLPSAPNSDMWVVIIDSEIEEDKEEIFFHRRVGNTIYTYWVNRKNPKEHWIWSSVVMNDSAWLFNYILENTNTWFFIYKTSTTQVQVTWGKVFYDWNIYPVNWKQINISEWTNYIYLDEDFELQHSITLPTWNVIWVINKSWSTINIEKYNFIWFWFEWKKWDTPVKWVDYFDWKDWKDWVDGTDWDDGKSAYEIALDNWFVWTEEEWLESMKGKDWNIWEPTETWQYIEDTIVVNTSTHTVTTNNSTYIKITENATWNYVWYNLSARVWANSANEISNYELVTWTWWTIWLLEWITYIDWLSIDTQWTIRYTWQPAYRDSDNTFKKTNVFEWQTNFQWNVSFPYFRIDMTSKTDILFNTNNGTKQRTINLTTTWAKTLSFSNLVSWANYELAIVNNSWWSITIWKWTMNNPETDITKFYSIWWTTYPLTLSTWVHLFVMDTFDTAVHISYVWQSVEF